MVAADTGQGMTRSEFLSSIIGGVTAVKLVEEQTPDGVAPRGTKLLAIEYPESLSHGELKMLREALSPYCHKYDVEFMILHGGMRLVNPRVSTRPFSMSDSYGSNTIKGS